MIKLLGIIPTTRAQFNDEGVEISPAQYEDDSYYAMSSQAIEGLTAVNKPPLAPSLSGVQTFYYAFTDEQAAKEALEYDKESASFNIPFELTVEQFKRSRQEQLDSATVTTLSGKEFDADEASMSRMVNALTAAADEQGATIIPWSLANDGTGVMTDCTKAEIKEAHRLAVKNMAAIWSV